MERIQDQEGRDDFSSHQMSTIDTCKICDLDLMPVCGIWYVVCGIWYVVFWYVVCEMWYVICDFMACGIY